MKLCMRKMVSPFLLGILMLLTACSLLNGDKATPPGPEIARPEAHPELTPVRFADLSGWAADDQSKSMAAFAKSCVRIMKAPANTMFGFGSSYRDWQEACRNLPDPATVSSAQARTYFEHWFTPYLVKDQHQKGLFTGYYEPALQGSLVRKGSFQTPLRARPSDLVMVNLGEFRPELKGQRIAGRVVSGQLKPYEDRAGIETGKLPSAMDTALYWINSPVDAFFLHIQGSGVVVLPDGTSHRIGYDGQNGYPYTAIGKELVARGALDKDNVSMQTIRDWLAQHPEDAANVMRTNKSYVFFKKLDTGGPVGAEGVVLTPERSLAVDHTVWPYGLPMFVAATDPVQLRPLEKLLIAQDTGGAITGSIRGDFFWGYGDDAAHRAGLMKSEGRLWVLFPKTTSPKFQP